MDGMGIWAAFCLSGQRNLSSSLIHDGSLLLIPELLISKDGDWDGL